MVACRPPPSEHGTWIEARPAPPLEAVDVKTGQPFRLADEHGKLKLLSFGFSSCPQVCPATLSKMHRLLEVLGTDASSVEVLFVSVDPARDTPARLRGFLAEFDTRIGGLFLEGDALARVLDAYEVSVSLQGPEVRRYRGSPSDPSREYTMEHTSSMVLIDGAGRLRARFTPRAEPEELAAVMRRIFDEPQPLRHATWLSRFERTP
jgi:protein SCO1/2